MRKFSKETKDFLGNIKKNRNTIIQPIPASGGMISPGDLLFFHYSVGTVTSQRLCLVVRCRRGHGIFHGRSGLLLSCFKLTDGSSLVVDMILENLYKKRRAASYYGKVKNSLIALLGQNTFRTYKLNKMQGLNKITIGGY